MPKTLSWRILFTLGIIAVSCWFTFPLKERIKLGLDLQGGMHLILNVDTSKVAAGSKSSSDVTSVVIEIVRKRLDPEGVKELLIQRQGERHILVQLPGETDRGRVLKLIGQTGLLEFQLVSDNQRLIQQAIDGAVPPGHRLAEDGQGSPLLLETDQTLTGAILSDADVDAGEFGLPVVSFRLNKDGARHFGLLTGSHVGRRLAIVLDGKVQSAPVIQSRITDAGQITGRFTKEEAHDLSAVLRYGSLPAPISVEEERTVGPTLGKDSIRAGLFATAVGAAFVVAFMVGYYFVAGAIAVIALVLNLLLTLGGLGYFHASLTLPGIAGIVLTLGMAVDANVLIYERIREELKAGRPLSLAIDAGYAKAFSAILDSNMTTVVAAAFLWSFGTGPIRGFATTLTIGLIASMFTAIFVTRIVFDLLLSGSRLKTLKMAQWVPKTTIDFVGKRAICYLLSLVVLGAGVAAFILRGDNRYGVDFSGGLLQEYRFTQPMTADQLRSSLATVGLHEAVIQQYGSPNEWLLRTPDNTKAESDETILRTHEVLMNDYPSAQPTLLRNEQVGPAVGKDLRQKAWLAIAWSMVGILVYVAVRFKHWDFAAAGVIALIHDVIVAAGALCLLGRQIDMVIIAALLTIAGFSSNDTIVIYDRVRENRRLNPKLSIREVINLSINETLSRTLLTSLTVIFEVAALYWFGGEVLRDFSICLLAGFISGVYSTVYIASALVISWRPQKPAHATPRRMAAASG